MRWRLFGKRIPDWMFDPYRLIRYMNFIELIPTFSAIAFAPRHFFRRLPQFLLSKDDIHVTPLVFLANAISLTVAIIYFLLQATFPTLSMTPTKLSLYVFLGVVLAPVWIVILAFLLLIIYHVPGSFPSSNNYRPPNYHGLILSIEPRSYLRLDWKRFFAGLLYCGIYFYITFQLTQPIWILAILVLEFALTFFGNSIHTPNPYLLVGVVTLIFIPIGRLTHEFVMRPYGELIRASARIPLKRCHREDTYEISQHVNAILQGVPIDSKARSKWRTIYWDSVVPLQELLTRLKQIVKLQDFDYRNLQEESLNLFHQERQEVYSEAFQILKLETALNSPAITLKERDRLLVVINSMKSL